MSGFYPIPSTRSTNLLGQTRLIQQLNADQLSLQRLQNAITQLLNTANQNFRGRYLFAGSRSATAPFALTAQGVVYNGNEGSLDSFVDVGLPYATNASGADVFGTFSAEVQGSVDLNPALA